MTPLVRVQFHFPIGGLGNKYEFGNAIFFTSNAYTKKIYRSAVSQPENGFIMWGEPRVMHQSEIEGDILFGFNCGTDGGVKKIGEIELKKRVNPLEDNTAYLGCLEIAFYDNLMLKITVVLGLFVE